MCVTYIFLSSSVLSLSLNTFVKKFIKYFHLTRHILQNFIPTGEMNHFTHKITTLKLGLN